MAGTAISANGNSLQTSTILTSNIDHHSGPDANAQLLQMAHANASGVPYVDWPKKIIPIKGQLLYTGSLAALDQLEDTFKSYLTGTNFNLDIGYAGSTRRYICLYTSKTVITRPQELFDSKFDVEFTCQPWGMDTTSTTLVNLSGQTTSQLTMTPTFGGTFPLQYPVIQVTMTTVGGSPVSGTVSIGNNNNGQQVTVTRTWSSGDVLTIDTTQLLNTAPGASQPVTVNSAPVAWSGALPEFTLGSSSIFYGDTFSSRTFSILITNQNRYT